MDKSNKDIWYIALCDLSRPGTAETIHSREDANGLKKNGWNVTLFAKSTSKDKSFIASHEKPITSRKGGVGRLEYEVKLICQLFKKRPDFIFFRGPTNLIFFAFFVSLMRVKFGMELNGVLAYRYNEGGVLRKKLEKRVDSFFMRNSSLLVGVTEELSDLARRESNNRAQVITARNGINLDQVQPSHSRTKSNVLKIGYLGKAYKNRGLDIAIEVVHELRQKGVEASLLAVGGGPEVNNLLKKAESLNLESGVIKFTAEVPPEKMGEHVSECNIMWAYFEPWVRYDLTGLSPLKIWTYLALCKPVLVFDPGVLKVYRSVPGLIWVDQGSVSAISDLILKVYRDNTVEDFNQLGRKGLEYVKKHVSWDRHAKLISDAIETMV